LFEELDTPAQKVSKFFEEILANILPKDFLDTKNKKIFNKSKIFNNS